MPYTKRKITSGKWKGRYRVTSPSGTKAKHSTAANAAKMLRLMRDIEHGMVPRK